MHRHIAGKVDTSKDKAIVLVGNPNVGKSVIFSYLTGSYAAVSNYPGTTVEVSRGRLKNDASLLVIDTPGANSLHPHSVDEKVTRDILFSSNLQVVVQVADAKNLRRSLTLTTQLAEMGLPVVLVLNMMDEASHRGIKISGLSLSEKIGIPIVETVAIEKKGLRTLGGVISREPRIPAIRVEYHEAIERAIEEISGIIPELRIRKRALALMFLADPDDAVRSLSHLVGAEAASEAAATARKVQQQFSNPLSYIIGVSRSKAVDKLLDAVYLRDYREFGAGARAALRRRQALISLVFTVASLAGYALFGPDKLAAAGLHPTLLHLVVLLFLFTVLPYRMLERLTTHYILGGFFLLEVLYLLYKFVGVFGAGTLVDAVENRLFHAYILPFLDGVAARVIGFEFLRDLLLGEYGLISMGLTYSVAIVMPIVATFFFAFGILEDSGYLPRLSVIADRLMRRVGLNGKAVLPMVLGLGCATMATLTTRILDSRKERVIATLLLALGIPCSAQLGVIVAIISQTSIAVTLTVIVVVLFQLVLVGALSSMIVKGRSTDFIVELPPLRPPQLLNILTKTGHRLKWFLYEAVPLFLAGTLILFIADRLGGLSALERLARPVIIDALGLPIESTVAFIVGFFRRDYGAAGLYDLFGNGMLTHNQVAVSMVVITLFVPCIANFLVMIKERGIKTALCMVAFILPYALIVGTALNYFLRITGIEL